jgi:2-iminobutanoate/2-iminopropanoate deaminase
MGAKPRSWQPVPLPPDHSPPAGAYSPVVRAGDFVYTSGQIPRDFATGALLGNDIESQTRGVLGNVAKVLGYAGCTLDDVVSVTAYLARIEDWDAFNRVYREHFTAPYPSRTTVGAGLHGVLVEISAVAILRGSGS